MPLFIEQTVFMVKEGVEFLEIQELAVMMLVRFVLMFRKLRIGR